MDGNHNNWKPTNLAALHQSCHDEIHHQKAQVKTKHFHSIKTRDKWVPIAKPQNFCLQKTMGQALPVDGALGEQIPN